MSPGNTTRTVRRTTIQLRRECVCNPFLILPVDEKKQKTMDTINDAKQRVKGDINQLKDKLKLARETICKFKTELNKIQGDR